MVPPWREAVVERDETLAFVGLEPLRAGPCGRRRSRSTPALSPPPAASTIPRCHVTSSTRPDPLLEGVALLAGTTKSRFESLAESKHCRFCWPNGQRIGRRNGNGRLNGTGGHSTVRAGNGTGSEIPTRQNRQNRRRSQQKTSNAWRRRELPADRPGYWDIMLAYLW